jgi:hypothetical protein
MKKLLLLPFFAMLMFACGPGKNDVIKLNNDMVAQVSKCSLAEKSFFEACSSYNPSTINRALKEFTATCKKVKAELEATDVHEDLAKLKASALHLAGTYVGLEKEYAEYARLYSIPTEKYSAEDEKQTSITAGKINDAINAEFDANKATQKEFSEKYHFKVPG